MFFAAPWPKFCRGRDTHRRMRGPPKKDQRYGRSWRRPTDIGSIFIWRRPDLRRRGGGNADQVQPRLQAGRPCRAVPAAARQGLLQIRRRERDHRGGGGFRRVDRPGRLGQLRHGLRRHQRADEIPRRQSGGGAEGGVHGLQPATIRGNRPQEPRHQHAEGSGRQDARRAGYRHQLYAMADLRESERHRCIRGEDRKRGLPGARADARRRPGRCGHRLLVCHLHRPQGQGRSG